VAFSSFSGRIEGQVLVVFIIAIAAAEVAVGLAILVALYRKIQSVGTDDVRVLRG
jgi:NADH-quinone oxidoreductase subunit K